MMPSDARFEQKKFQVNIVTLCMCARAGENGHIHACIMGWGHMPQLVQRTTLKSWYFPSTFT